MPQVGLTKSAAQELLNDYSVKIDNAMEADYAIDLIEAQLQAQLNKIQQITSQAFSLLGYTGSIEDNEKELSRNVVAAQIETATLNGAPLEENFIRNFKAVDPFQLDRQKEYDLIKQMLEQEVYSETFFRSQEEKAATIFMSIMQGTSIKNDTMYITVNSGGKIRESNTGKLVGFKYDDSYASLGKTAKNKISEFIKKYGDKIKKFSEHYSENEADMSWLLETIDINSFLKMSTEERLRVLDAYPGLLQAINKAYSQSIIDLCPSADKKILQGAIQEVLSNKEDAFFVGGNTNQLIGILGEIQGIYIFRRIIKNNSKRSKIDWVGGLNNPHADLLLKAALGEFGIQIKNKSWEQAQDDLISIDFKNFNETKTLIEGEGSVIKYNLTSEALSAAAGLGIDMGIFDAIQSALAADTFNVYYQWNSETKQAEAVDDNPAFTDVRRMIEIYSAKAEKIMSLYSVALMYMQAAQMTGGEASANTFYLVAGATVVSAATILANIIKELHDSVNTHFRTQVKTSYKGAQKTIIDVLNSGRDARKTEVISFVLQSSYNF